MTKKIIENIYNQRRRCSFDLVLQHYFQVKALPMGQVMRFDRQSGSWTIWITGLVMLGVASCAQDPLFADVPFFTNCQQQVESFAIQESNEKATNIEGLLAYLVQDGGGSSMDSAQALAKYLRRQTDTLDLVAREATRAIIIQNVLHKIIEDEALRMKALQWVEEKITSLETETSSLESARQEAQPIRVPMTFARVKAGRFQVPGVAIAGVTGLSKWQLYELEIPYDFEILTVPVTVSMWRELMGDVPFGAGKVLTPVTNINYYSMEVFANRLSRKLNLTPAYRETPPEPSPWPQGRAEEGILTKSSSGLVSNRVRELEGFRLPTHAEWLKVASSILIELAQIENANARDAHMAELGWFYPQSSDDIQEVGQWTPLQIEGQKIWDLFGNAFEAFHQVYFEKDLAPGPPLDLVSVDDAEGAGLFHYRGGYAVGVVKGQGLVEAAMQVHVMGRVQRDRFTSFRLVRTRVSRPDSGSGAESAGRH